VEVVVIGAAADEEAIVAVIAIAAEVKTVSHAATIVKSPRLRRPSRLALNLQPRGRVNRVRVNKIRADGRAGRPPSFHQQSA
jgi:hypothetical protein